MGRLFSVAFSLLLGSPFVGAALSARPLTNTLREQRNHSSAPMGVPRSRRRHLRHEARRKRRGIGGSFKKGGTSAGQGGKGFGKNVARGKPIKAGRRLGKGMGGFGKHTGKGFGKTGKKIVKP
jgi:hypothetical protein